MHEVLELGEERGRGGGGGGGGRGEGGGGLMISVLLVPTETIGCPPTSKITAVSAVPAHLVLIIVYTLLVMILQFTAINYLNGNTTPLCVLNVPYQVRLQRTSKQ